MFNLQGSLNELEATTASIRVNGYMEANPHVAAKLPAFFEQLEKDSTAEFGTPPNNPAEVLAAYKNSVGNEVFVALASNPNLQKMAQEHCVEIEKQRVSKVVDALMEKIFKDSELSRRDVCYFLVYTVLRG